ncbi:MAG TPA: hypothetical protein PLE60_10990 [Candidatus Latescibacteria bacterium]|nr:hypothetical protein [Candidatus Latescibacterota bacterium]
MRSVYWDLLHIVAFVFFLLFVAGVAANVAGYGPREWFLPLLIAAAVSGAAMLATDQSRRWPWFGRGSR